MSLQILVGKLLRKMLAEAWMLWPYKARQHLVSSVCPSRFESGKHPKGWFSLFHPKTCRNGLCWCLCESGKYHSPVVQPILNYLSWANLPRGKTVGWFWQARNDGKNCKKHKGQVIKWWTQLTVSARHDDTYCKSVHIFPPRNGWSWRWNRSSCQKYSHVECE